MKRSLRVARLRLRTRDPIAFGGRWFWGIYGERFAHLACVGLGAWVFRSASLLGWVCDLMGRFAGLGRAVASIELSEGIGELILKR